MKYLLIILLIISKSVSAQIDTTKLDTVAVYIYYFNTTQYYDYYNANGVPAWKKVKGFDSALIPPGGWAIATGYVDPYSYIVNGFAIVRWKTDGRFDEFTGWLDINKKKLPKTKWVHPIFLPRKK